MRKSRRQHSLFRHVATLVAIPLALTSVGYALFTQQLSVQGAGKGVAYNSSQNLVVTYTKTVTQQGAQYLYNLNVTIKNNGTVATAGWQVLFDLPSDYTQLVCNSATCTPSGSRVTAVNTTSNGTIGTGSQTSFTLSFLTANSKYSLQNIAVSGVGAPTYQVVSGLTATHTTGAVTKVRGTNFWPYTFTIRNNSGRVITSWRLTINNWQTGDNKIQTMASTVNYVTGTNSLVISSKTSIANGSTFQFTASLGSSSNKNWEATYTLEGM